MELTGGVPEGLPNPDGKPVVTDITSVHVHTDLEPAGNFQCSDSMYERIDQMIDWSVRSNLSHVMTDCPHREKLGWLEETYLMWPSVAYRYDMSRFGAKIARDIRESQGADGVIYTVAPNYPSFSGGFRYTPEWGAAGVFIPWLCYQWYGDRDTLEQSYDSMKAFVDYMRNTSKDLVPVAGLGDWYDYGHGEKLGASRFTPTDLSAMACFYECAQTVVRAAGILGKPDDVRTYEKLCKDIYGKYNEKYYDGRGQYKNMGSPQTANAMSLVVGLVEPSQKKPVVEAIVADMKKRGNMQTSGDIGFRYLLRALALNGKSNMIFALLDREELGSYKYLVNAGWTSMPESWNAYRSYSMNHLMLGHIQEWFNGDLAGIQMAADAPAFKRIQIKPVCGGSVTSASATFQSPYGRISSSWTLEGDSFRLKISVPGNTSAQVHLPAKDVSKITEQGRAVRDIPGVRVVTEGGESVILEVGSGKYDFAAPWKP